MKQLTVSPSPHVHSPASTNRIMLDVVIALLPALLVSFLFYGWSELLVIAVSAVSCVGLEWLIARFVMKRPELFSGSSALVTGLLLAMNLPTTSPWWMIVVGAVVAIGIAKMSFGGLGQNIFNPAITARVFLLISFPVQMTNWAMPASGFIAADAVSGATPLGIIKEGIKSGLPIPEILEANGMSAVSILRDIGGSGGEISAVALLVGFVYLLIRKVVKPWIPLSIICTIALISLIFHGIDPDRFTGVAFNLVTGGVLLGAFFMATDYVTSPVSNWGGVVFGVGIGLIVMMIRYFGSYPEGMSFAILIMNCFVPLINRAFHQKKYGRA
ncbi:MAG: RnfABCDGE type electron transport complex subunit D [Bacteroidales bacterium]|nr:RnfABCDGE type electron transport complex subunit D [Bacteroidales bacterium]MBQ2228971.1 RnfABCDGE type electron transport complex subunit D [Bacteroidales bacterium]MBQ3942370.1 RnfABCDGE type electron transport complex subunit D [Bacteroidales bacterium]